VVLDPVLREGDRIIPISVLSQSTLLRFMISIPHLPTRMIESLHVQVFLPIPITLPLNRLGSAPRCLGVIFPHSVLHLLAFSVLLHPPSSTRFALHSPLTTSLRSVLRLQTAIPRPNLSNDETKSRSLDFRIW
jgi:hypothetical protein